jgi:hypothetical protein
MKYIVVNLTVISVYLGLVLIAHHYASNAKSIDSGFVFIDGKYIESPYKVTHDRGWMLVNNVRIFKLCKWPIRIKCPLNPDFPEIPEDLLENAKSFDDLRIPAEKDAWHSRMARWISSTFSDPDFQLAELKRFYESLPFVDYVEIEDGGIIEVIQKSGDVHRFRHESCAHEGWTKKSILEDIERRRLNLERRLAKGDTYLFFRRGPEISFGISKGERDLKLMVEVLDSNRTAKEKFRILQRMTILPNIEYASISSLIEDFSSSFQLRYRVNQLANSASIEPRILSDLPESTSWELHEKKLRESK